MSRACLRCGKREAISEDQPLCFDCLEKTRPKLDPRSEDLTRLFVGILTRVRE